MFSGSGFRLTYEKNRNQTEGKIQRRRADRLDEDEGKLCGRQVVSLATARPSNHRMPWNPWRPMQKRQLPENLKNHSKRKALRETELPLADNLLRSEIEAEVADFFVNNR